jgi:hypothetical protein
MLVLIPLPDRSALRGGAASVTQITSVAGAGARRGADVRAGDASSVTRGWLLRGRLPAARARHSACSSSIELLATRLLAAFYYLRGGRWADLL